MRRKWTKADKTLFLVYAGILAGWSHLSGVYQNCISFQPFVAAAFLIFFAGSVLVKNRGAQKSVIAGIGLALLLECAALYAVLPADTYAEGREKMEERWLAGYENVVLMAETRNYVSFFTGYDTEPVTRRVFNRLSGQSDAPVLRRTPYVYIFGADRDIAACIYDPFSGESRIAVLEDMRFGNWKQMLVTAELDWTEG